MVEVGISNVFKRYGAVEAIKGISASIKDGEFVVLVGPSGCGKSTLLRMIAGLEEISGGEISIGSKVVNDMQPKQRNIAMVFQNYALYPHMTVAQNMGFALRLARADKAEMDKRVKEVAEILGLTDYLDRFPRALSGGQRQRVAMGRAIVRDPAVFLFDEPLSNLDAKLRTEMRTEIKALHLRLRATMIYVTHDQIEAMTMADRIIVMHDGLVEQIGTPLELYDEPVNKFVAGFIGSPPMNFLPARISGGKLLVEAGPDSVAIAGLPDQPDREGLEVGIRPDKFEIADDGIPMRVNVVEPTGAEIQVVGEVDGKSMVVVFRDRLVFKHGEIARVRPQQDSFYLFDAETGDRLPVS
ncbi:sn-glycerol-3-phosphate ABC transporter ATP-binding protein UgpC [Mesorhizobium sp. Z1-4]|uniref:ABC transporter ATP-binding protein n=1 Tax=Mesorhizobium sp. Z1-4 TaxID=2448478 RepID=UPI000FD96B90|nr:sn-glycerol-3-phosphate ABC transporter ATP-binding protein UgpC [Mesorhizobium sp. Z1-4]